MSDIPVLSLIVAVYNGEKFLSAFFDSIKAQQISGLEIIVVNDGSTDNSASVINHYAGEFAQF
ncbi:glycosyltransferase, partial [Escherichia coli]|nr:glycosyltransferase [Escherichia coli]